MRRTTSDGSHPTGTPRQLRTTIYTALQGTQTLRERTPVCFDLDSYLIGIYGHASYCMANHPDQFDGDLKRSSGDHQVDGIGSGIAIKGMGTFKFKMEDNDGLVHTIRVPNSLYIPSLKQVLLAPHHWAQEAQDNVPTPRGTWMATYNDCIILYWNQCRSKHTIFLSTSTNTPLIHTALGTKVYRTYSAVIEALKACTPPPVGITYSIHQLLVHHTLTATNSLRTSISFMLATEHRRFQRELLLTT